MNLDVYIKDTTTGVVAKYRHEDTDRFDDFIWSEGNYSCDCNRSVFFAEATGNDQPEDACEPACGDGRFKIIQIVPEGQHGPVLYSELERVDACIGPG